MSDEGSRYDRLEAGAVYLAAIATSTRERIEHLKMAGTYHCRAREAGSCAGAATRH